MREINLKRRNRVFKSLHKPLTYLGVERTLFYFVCVGAVGVFNLFESLLAGIIVFIGGYAFGRWVTGADPAMLRILAQSERLKLSQCPYSQGFPASMYSVTWMHTRFAQYDASYSVLLQRPNKVSGYNQGV